MGVFEATRMATGRRNANRIEVNGELGSVAFDFERMNELEYFDGRGDEPDAEPFSAGSSHQDSKPNGRYCPTLSLVTVADARVIDAGTSCSTRSLIPRPCATSRASDTAEPAIVGL